MNGSSLPAFIRKTLDRYRRRWRTVHAGAGALAAFGVALAAVGVAVLLDRLSRGLPRPVRATLLSVILTALAALLAWMCLRPLLRRIGDRRAASRLGEQSPDVAEDLYSAVELSDHPDPGVSRGLVASALDQISQRARSVDVRRAASLRGVLKASLAFVAVLAVMGVAWASAPAAMRNGLTRLFRPDLEVPLYRYTRIHVSVSPRSGVVRKGDPVEARVELTGEVPSAARVQVRPSGGEPAEIVIPTPDGYGGWKSGRLFEDMTFRVVAGDGETGWRRVRVVPAPRLASRSAVIELPSYAGKRRVVVEKPAGPLELVEGSRLSLRCEPGVRGADARFACRAELVRRKTEAEGKGPARLAFTGKDKVLATPFFKPEGRLEYEVRLLDGFGLRNRHAEIVDVKVRPDALPRVLIKRPGRDAVILPNERVAVEAVAEDDLGLRGLRILWRVTRAEGDRKPSTWRTRDLAKGAADKTVLRGKTVLTPSELGLRAGDQIEYKAVSADFADDAILRRADSPVYRIVIISEMEHLERVLQKLKDLQVELMRLAVKQKIEAGRTDGLKAEAKHKDVGRESAEARDRERELTRAVENVAQRLRKTLPELTRNPSAPTRSVAELDRISRHVKGVADKPMTEASKSLGGASQCGKGKKQPQQLQSAKKNQEKAAEDLQRLARMLNRLRRRSLLEKLAEEAERLAELQTEVRKATAGTAMATAGRPRERLEPRAARMLERLATRQQTLRAEVKGLAANIERAARSLSFSSPKEAAVADEAAGKMEKDAVVRKVAAIARKIARNVLFSQMKPQDEVSASLREVAAILRRSIQEESMERVAKVLEEFIRRQRELNQGIGKTLRKETGAAKPVALGEKQALLEQDVAEQAGALSLLAQESRLFDSLTARKLDAAAGEMRAGAEALYSAASDRGLAHGKEALKLLESAREEFGRERRQMNQAQCRNRNMEAVLLLYRILLGQKRVNQRTQHADRIHTQAPKSFTRAVTSVTKRQGEVRTDMRRLTRMLARAPRVAAYLKLIAGKMDLSRVALTEADTARETRVVQSKIVAMLEKLLCGQCKGMGSCRGAAQSLMQMMGKGGGGFEGGGNAPIMPAGLDEAREEDWTKKRSRFEGKLGAAVETEFPVEFRGLLNAYFEELRKEAEK